MFLLSLNNWGNILFKLNITFVIRSISVVGYLINTRDKIQC